MSNWTIANTKPSPWVTARAMDICRLLNVRFEDLAAGGRHERVVFARQVYAYTLRNWAGPAGEWATFADIAKSADYRNHSTAVSNYRDIKPAGVRAAEEIVRQMCSARGTKPILVEAAVGRL